MDRVREIRGQIANWMRRLNAFDWEVIKEIKRCDEFNPLFSWDIMEMVTLGEDEIESYQRDIEFCRLMTHTLKLLVEKGPIDLRRQLKKIPLKIPLENQPMICNEIISDSQ